VSLCVGCEEPLGPDAIRVAELGRVCPLCHEVIDIVFEVEIEKVRRATAIVRAFVERLEGL
jgi:hypothetical protein